MHLCGHFNHTHFGSGSTSYDYQFSTGSQQWHDSSADGGNQPFDGNIGGH